MKQVLFWFPRVLCILFALFLSLFAPDVFSEDSSVWDKIVGLLIHLVPVYVVAILLIVAWRWEWVGAIVFTGLGLFYLSQAWGQEHWAAIVTISGSLTLIGVLFLLNWTYQSTITDRIVVDGK
jgi:hypothetical protein